MLTMVDAKAAGVMFSLNPTDGDETKVVMEGNWGLGEAVVSGSVNPDKFLVDKVVLQIEERTISRKEMEFAYNEKTGEMEYRDLPPEMKEVPCLEDREILELAKVSKKIEAYFGCPQDSEWVISKKPSLSGKRVPRPDKAGNRVEQEKERIGSGAEERPANAHREGHHADQGETIGAELQ